MVSCGENRSYRPPLNTKLLSTFLHDQARIPTRAVVKDNRQASALPWTTCPVFMCFVAALFNMEEKGAIIKMAHSMVSAGLSGLMMPVWHSVDYQEI